MISTGKQHLDPHPFGLPEVNPPGIDTLNVIESSYHVSCRVMSFKIGALVSHLPISGRMRPTEGILVELGHLHPDLLGNFRGYPVPARPLEEIAGECKHLLLRLALLDGFPQAVAFLPGKISKDTGHQHRIVLVEHDSIGVSQHLF